MSSYLPRLGESTPTTTQTTSAPSSPVTSSGQINPYSAENNVVSYAQPTTTTARTTATAPTLTQQSLPSSTSTQTVAPSTQPNTAPQPTIDPNHALNQLQSYASSKYGRQMTQQEVQQLMAAVGYQGQPVTQALLQQAMSLIDQYAGQQQPPPPPPTGGPVQYDGPNPLADPNTGEPTGMGWDPVTGTMSGGGSPYVSSSWSGTPEQAIAAINARLARYGVGNLTAQQIQSIVQAVGYTGGNVTGDQYNAAIDYLMKIYGVDPKQPPTGKPTPPPGPPPPKPPPPGGDGGENDPIYKPGTAPARQTPFYGGYTFDRTGLPTYTAYQYRAQAPNAPGAYQFQWQTPDAYQAGNITQFGGVPGLQQTQGMSTNLLRSILQNPYSMSDQGVAQMKEANKEQSLDMQKQLQDQLGLNNASRGTFGGGYMAASNRDLGQQLAQSVMQSNRAIDVQKMLQDRTDVLNALGIGEQAMSGQANRAMGLYNTGLQGQMSQEALRQAAAQSALQRAQFDLGAQGMQAGENNSAYQRALQNALFGFNVEQAQAQQGLLSQQSQSDAVKYQNMIDQLQATHNLATHGANLGVDQFDLNRFLAQEQLNQAGIQSIFQNREANRAYGLSQQDMARLNRALDIQQQLGQAGLGLDERRLDSSNRQFDLGYLLNIMQFLESQRQFNQGMGFNYDQLNASGFQNYLNQLLGGI